MKKTVLWKAYRPYNNCRREGWQAKVGRLTVRIHQEFRLSADGTPRWIGHVDGCSASIELLRGHCRLSVDEGFPPRVIISI